MPNNEKFNDLRNGTEEKITKMDKDEQRFNKLLRTIFSICDLAGFKISGRITLVDQKTGRIYK